MSFAYVFVHARNGKTLYQTVRTDSIKKFNTDVFVCTDKHIRSQVPYRLAQADGSYNTCQVLAIAGMFI